MIRYVGHKPGTGSYELVDNATETVVYRGTLSECTRKAYDREKPRRRNAIWSTG